VKPKKQKRSKSGKPEYEVEVVDIDDIVSEPDKAATPKPATLLKESDLNVGFCIS